MLCEGKLGIKEEVVPDLTRTASKAKLLPEINQQCKNHAVLLHSCCSAGCGYLWV